MNPEQQLLIAIDAWLRDIQRQSLTPFDWEGLAHTVRAIPVPSAVAGFPVAQTVAAAALVTALKGVLVDACGR